MKNFKKNAYLYLTLIVLLLTVSLLYVYFQGKQPYDKAPSNSKSVTQKNTLGGLNYYGEPASNYSIDNSRVYYDEKIINADYKTFEILRGNLEEMKGYITYKYARDGKSVYYDGVLLSDANPKTFKPLENGSRLHSYGTDGQTVYFYSYPIKNADPETFKILWQTIWEGCPLTDYSKDKTSVYFNDPVSKTSSVLPGADAQSFEALIKGFGKDKHGYYKGTTYIGPTINLSELNCEVG